MQTKKFASGAFVFTRARGLQPHDPDDLPPLAARHGIDSTCIPTYAGDRVAISRAISRVLPRSPDEAPGIETARAG